MRSKDISSNRNYYITVARELFYGEAVISKIKNAKTEAEVLNILASARKGEHNDDRTGKTD